jgi:hypothetical protein
MKRLIIRLADLAVTGALKLLDAIFPEPTDDLMAVARAAGVTVEQQEQLDYHRAACELAEMSARSRSAQHEADFEAWRQECLARGEQA